MKKLTTDEFIEKARKKHGDNFIYDKVIYVKSNLDVLIGCKNVENISHKPQTTI